MPVEITCLGREAREALRSDVYEFGLAIMHLVRASWAKRAKYVRGCWRHTAARWPRLALGLRRSDHTGRE